GIVTVSRSVSLVKGVLVSNIGTPAPKTTGLTKIQYSSIRFSCFKSCPTFGLPNKRMSFPIWFFRFLIVVIESLLSRIVLLSCSSLNWVERTNLVTLLYHFEKFISSTEAVRLFAISGQYP